MIAEAIKALTQLVRDADKPHEVKTTDPGSAVFLVGGKEVRIEQPPPPRDHAVGTIEDLAALASRFQVAAAGGGGTPPSCWYDVSAVILVIDDDGHRAERATLVLAATSLFQRVARLKGAEPMDHREFLRLLRVGLAGALPPASLLEKIRRVSFESGKVVRSRVGRADESMGREINAAVSAEGDIPEYVTLRCPMYRGLDYEAVVPCAVEVDADRGTFALVPLPDALERAADTVMAQLGGDLSAAMPGDVPVYRGRP